jgi:hypothetical protein
VGGLAIIIALMGAPVWASPPAPRLPQGHRPAAGDRVAPNLVRRADGSYEHRDRANGFAATIHPDGSVTFRQIARVKFEKTTIIDQVLHGKTKPTQDEQFNDKSNTLLHRGAQTDTKSDPAIDYGPYGEPVILAKFGTRMGGLADWVTKGQTAKARRDFLANTATLRARLRTEMQRARERQAMLDLGDSLRAIWSDSTLDAATRRRRIFELWDDCAEASAAGSPEDAARAEAGTKARRVIEAFVRRTARPDSRDAYSQAELGRLNASRRSVARFDPYPTQ